MKTKRLWGHTVTCLSAAVLASASIGAIQLDAPRAAAALGPANTIFIVDGAPVNPVNGCVSEVCYEPLALRVPRGTKVTWLDSSFAPHTVTRCTIAACGVSGATGTNNLPMNGQLLPWLEYQAT